MDKVVVGIEDSHTNAPLVWAEKSNLFDRHGLDIELLPKKFHSRRLNLFNALDLRQVDLIIAPFENAVERMACEYPITMIKQFARMEAKSRCYGIESGLEIENQSRFLGFAKTDFEFEFFAAEQKLARKAIDEYFQVATVGDAVDAMKEDGELILFSNNLSDHSIDIPSDMVLVDGQSNESPTSVMLAHELPDGSFNTTSGMPHNEFVDFMALFSIAISEAVEEIRDSEDAISALESEFGCSKIGLRNRVDEIEWVHGFEPALESTQSVTKVLTKTGLSPNCDFYGPAEFWNMPAKRQM